MRVFSSISFGNWTIKESEANGGVRIGENNLSHRRKHTMSDVVVLLHENQSTSKLN